MNWNSDRPADRRACAKCHMDAAEQLLVLEHVSRQPRLIIAPDAQLSDVAAGLAMGPSSSSKREVRTVRAHQCFLADDQLRRWVAEPEGRDARRHQLTIAPGVAMLLARR